MKVDDIKHIFTFLINNKNVDRDALDFRVVFKEFKFLNLVFLTREKEINTTINNVKVFLDELNIYENKEKEVFVNKINELNDDEINCLVFLIDNRKEVNYINLNSLSDILNESNMSFSSDTIEKVIDFYNYFKDSKFNDKKMVRSINDIENKIHKSLDIFETGIVSKINDFHAKVENECKSFHSKIDDIIIKKDNVKIEFSKYEVAIDLILKLQTKNFFIDKVDYENVKNNLNLVLNDKLSNDAQDIYQIINDTSKNMTKELSSKVRRDHNEVLENLYTAYLYMKKTSVALISSAASIDVLNEILNFSNRLDSQELTKIIDKIEMDVVNEVSFREDFNDDEVLYYFKKMRKELDVLIDDNKKRKANEKKSVINFFAEKMKNINKMIEHKEDVI